MKKAMEERDRSGGRASSGDAGGARAGTARPTPPPTTSPAELRRQRRTRLIAGGATAGAGLLVAGAGGALLGLAAKDADTLHQVALRGDVWSTSYDDIYREGDRSQTAGLVLLAVGGAAIVAGGIVAILGARIKAAPPPRR
jgi:hypothetical protein